MQTRVPVVENLGEGVIRTYYHDGAIVVYRLSVVNEAATKTLFAAIIERLETWPAGKPYRCIIDIFSHMTISLEQVAQNAHFFGATRPDLHGRVAIVVRGRSQQFEALSRLMQSAFAHQPRHFHLFRSDTEAIEWLTAPTHS